MPTILPGALPNIPGAWPGNYRPASYAGKEFDYVIVGGGTAGAVLANRLSADGKSTVLVLEAGYSDSRQLFSRIPAGFPFLFRKDADWNYTTEPQPNLNGRSLYCPRAKMLGGCSASNALIYQRCARVTYDEWGRENPGWDYDSLRPYFDRAEGHIPHARYVSDAADHGHDGPWKTRVSVYTNPLSEALLQASEEMGIPRVADINHGDSQLGTVRLTTTSDDKGRRSSTAQAYLDSKVRSRTNLTIGVGVTTTRILFDGKTAVGVEFAKDARGRKMQVRARREVILSSGAINTPQVMLLSGVGPASELASHSVPLVHDLAGVGKNLIDHLTTSGMIYYTKKDSLEYLKHELKSGPAFAKWLLAGKGPMTSNLAETAMFVRHADVKAQDEEAIPEPAGDNAPDLELLSAHVNYLDHALEKVPQKGTLSIGAIHINPTSRGEVRLRSASPWEKPIIDPRYLSTENDRKAMAAGLRLTLRLAAQKPLQEFIESSFDFKKHKGFARFRGKGEFDKWSDEELLDLARETAFTIYHPVGTAKMGPASDPSAVVDSELRVHGIANLRVVDASIMPTIVRGHPQAAVVAIAERASDLIKEGGKRGSAEK